LAFNASLQIVFSSSLGFVMLVPMQPWGRRLRLPVDRKALLAAHLRDRRSKARRPAHRGRRGAGNTPRQ
jgi:hypothetical protein